MRHTAVMMHTKLTHGLHCCTTHHAAAREFIIFAVRPQPPLYCLVHGSLHLKAAEGMACLQILSAGVPRQILDLPGSCFLPEHEPYVSAIFRHILEDPVTLQAAMEAEIRNTLTARGSQANAAGGEIGRAWPSRQRYFCDARMWLK